MSGGKRFAALLVALFVSLTGVLIGTASSNAAPPYTHKPHIKCTPRVLVNTHAFCSGDHYLPNDDVVLTMHTASYPLGTVHTDASGAFSNFRVEMPHNVLGTHTVIGTGRGGAPSDSASTLILIYSLGTGGQGTGGQGAGGGTSFTGVAVVGLGVIGIGLLATGTLLVISGRRRRQALA